MMSLEKLEVVIEGDSSGLQKEFRLTEKGLFGLKQATNRLGLNKAFNTKQAESSLQNLQRKMELNAQQMQRYQQEAARLRDVIANPPKVNTVGLEDQLTNLRAKSDSLYDRIISKQTQIANLQNQSASAGALGKNPEKIDAALQKAQASLVSLNTQFDSTITKIERIEGQLSNSGSGLVVEKAKNDLIRLEQTMNNLERSNAATAERYRKLKDDLSGVGEAGKRASVGIKSLNKETKKSAGPLDAMGKMLSQAFKRIVIMATAYKLIRSAASYLTDALKTNKKFADSLNAIKVNLAIAFQPIYDFILPAINALMSALARAAATAAVFINALFGKTYSESKDATKGLDDAKKAMAGYGDSAEDAKNQVAGFDKFNDITPQKSAGGTEKEKNGLNFEDIKPPDISWVDALIEKLEPIRDFFKQKFLIAWDIAGPPIKNLGSEIAKLGENLYVIGESFAIGIEKGLEQSKPYFNQIADNLAKSTGNLAAVGAMEATAYIGGFNDAFEKNKEVLTSAIEGGTASMIESTAKLNAKGTEVAAEFTDGLRVGLERNQPRLRAGWEGFWSGVQTGAAKIWTGISEGWQAMTDRISGALDKIMPHVNKFGELIMETVSRVWEVVGPIVGKLVDAIGGFLGDAFKTVGEICGTVFETIIEVVGGILRALNGLINFVTGVFTGDWTRAWEGIKEVFSGIWDAIKGVTTGVINIIIDALNFFIRGINKIHFDIPDWVPLIGGNSWGFSIPEIPHLATGGIAYGEVQAIVGDNFNARQDPEVVSPLSDLQQMITAAVLQRDIAGGGSNGETRLTLVLDDGTVLVDAMIDPVNKRAKALGYAAVFKPV